MRFAIISDIHSNLEALVKTFEIIDQSGVDRIVCLGDVVGYGANPNECVDLVRNRCSNVLLGNHDAAAIDLSASEFFNYHARAAAIWTNRELTEKNKGYLRGLAMSALEEKIFFVHASPCEPADWEYIIDEEEAQGAFGCFSEEICFVGHTHVPACFSENGQASAVEKGQRYLVNVGSVGQPRDGNPKLSFGIFDSGTWDYQNVRSAYDTAAAAGKIREAGLPVQLAERLFRGV